MMRVLKIATVGLLTLMLSVVTAGMASAALPAPNWMPGSPILAGSQVILLWTPIPGAVKYNIYINGKKLQESVSIQAIVNAPEDAGSFEFQIAGVDGTGAEGAKSSPGIVKIFKLVPPKNIDGRMIGKNLALHWDPVGGAVLYNVYRSNESGKSYALVDSIQDVRWTDSKIEQDKKYYYRVTAKDASGKESGHSTEFMVSTALIAASGADKIKNVTGKRTNTVSTVTDKDFGDAGIIHIFEPYDIESSPDRSRYYVSSVNTYTILILDADGKFVKAFGGSGEKDGKFLAPYGIGVGPDGRVYVADSAKNNVQVFSAEGNFERVFATVTKTDWMKESPNLADVDVDDKGDVYILEYRNGAVIKYGSGGSEISHFVKKGKEPDDTGFLPYFKVKGNKIYLGDGGQGRVVITDMKGKTLQTIGKRGVGVGLLQSMGGFDVTTEDGMIYIVDRALNLVQAYKLSNGEYLFTLSNKDNTSPMPLMGAKAIAVDAKKQRVFVAQGIINQIITADMFGKPEEAKAK